jgi:uncharacterized protein YjbI with pentapeptide repeats
MVMPAAVRCPRDLPDVAMPAETLTITDDGKHADAVVDAVVIEETDPADVTLDRVVLRGVDLSFQRLRHVRIRDAVLHTCDLSNLALVEPSFIRVELRDCRVSGLTFEGGRLEDVAFHGCRGEVVSWIDVRGTRVAIEDCDWPDADFRATTLTDVLIGDSQLVRSQWTKARLTSARLTATALDSVKGAAGLAGASIDHQTLQTATLGFADALGIAVWDEPVDG